MWLFDQQLRARLQETHIVAAAKLHHGHLCAHIGGAFGLGVLHDGHLHALDALGVIAVGLVDARHQIPRQKRQRQPVCCAPTSEASAKHPLDQHTRRCGGARDVPKALLTQRLALILAAALVQDETLGTQRVAVLLHRQDAVRHLDGLQRTRHVREQTPIPQLTRTLCCSPF